MSLEEPFGLRGMSPSWDPRSKRRIAGALPASLGDRTSSLCWEPDRSQSDSGPARRTASTHAAGAPRGVVGCEQLTVFLLGCFLPNLPSPQLSGFTPSPPTRVPKTAAPSRF